MAFIHTHCKYFGSETAPLAVTTRSSPQNLGKTLVLLVLPFMSALITTFSL